MLGTGPPSYLVAVGTGTVVQLHGILAACPVVLAWAGEAGVALGHDVDVHWPWTAKPLSVSGRSPRGLTVTPPFPSALAPSPASWQPLPVSVHRGQLALPGQHIQFSQSPINSAIVQRGKKKKITVGHHSEALLQSNQLL